MTKEREALARLIEVLGARERLLRDDELWGAFTQAVAALASGIETEGHDPAEGHGAKHESPAPKGDAPHMPGDTSNA